MYKDYFGFKEDPFSIAPDPQFLYMSERHREALAHLIYGMKADSGFVLLTGEVGTGKTTVCRCLLGQIPDDSEIAFILNPKLSVIELLATICDELGIVYPHGTVSVKTFVDLINTFLLAAHAKERQTVLIIDEAQNLSVDVLEQIRLLTNLETDKHKLLQVIMLGQPELNSLLARPDLRQLAQRVTARYHLEPLDKQELHGYLQHRLAVAGVERPLFSASSINKLYALSGGVPRLINLLCDRALLGAYVQGRSTISADLLKQAAQEVFGPQDSALQPDRSGRLVPWLYVVLLSLVLCVAIVFVGAFLHLSRPDPGIKGNHGAQEIKAVQPRVELVEPLAWNSEEPVERSRLLAYQTLFQLWGFDQLELDRGAGEKATELGLKLINRRAGLGLLQRLNRPAVLKIVDPQGGHFYATLAALDDSVATIVSGSEVRQVPVAQLVSQWFGDYGLLWKPPQGYRGVIRPGEQNSMVPWLERQMALISGREETGVTKTHLTGSLLEEIKAFQERAGITADGVVGPHTLILINTRVAKDRPTLHKNVDR